MVTTDMSEFIDYFHFDEECESFEDYGHENGGRTWFARDLMSMLGYESFSSFENAINKAIQACTTLKIPILDNFTQIERDIEGKRLRDYKLSRFACYLTVMNGDVKKPQVAKAQAYFAAMAETVRKHVRDAQAVERLIIRDDVSERERSLAGVAKSAGVQHYGFFQNAGYRGMYNMNMGELKEHKGVDQKACLLDFMGKEELAANLFRITQTEAKIKSDEVRGQYGLEDAAYKVGRKVRHTMEEISGTLPENLKISEDIASVKKGLKQAQKEFVKIDNSKTRKQLTD